MKKVCSDGTVKIHYTTNELVQSVVDDLISKYPKENYTVQDDVESSKICTWDPGGMMMTGDENLDMDLGEITIRCKAQFFEYFCDAIEQYKSEGSRGSGTQYYKLHGKYYCICITVPAFEKLCELVKDEKLINQAILSRQKRLNKLAALSEQGAVVQVVKGEDGKLYKAQKKEDKSLN
jgi:hypothetical protein